jgi:hypothetical protein
MITALLISVPLLVVYELIHICDIDEEYWDYVDNHEEDDY